MRFILWLQVLFVLGELTTFAHAAIYVSALFQEYIFPSVNYFDVRETKWPYFDQVLSGRVLVLPSLNLDVVFPQSAGNATNEEQAPVNDVDDDWELDRWKQSPKFLLVDFGSASFETAMHNTSLAASKLGVDFVVLIVGTNVTWQQRFSFWWSHRFPGSTSENLSPGGNATHPHFYMAVQAWQGREIIQLVEREMIYLGNLSSEEFFFGIDNFDDFKGREMVVRLLSYLISVLAVSRWIRNNDENSGNRDLNNNRSTNPRFTGEDLGLGEIQSSSEGQDCPVCLETMEPGETVRILPCRHVLHHDCITGWFQHGKYSCPLCKMDLRHHLEEHRSATYEMIQGSTVRQRRRLWWPFGRRIQNYDAEHQLIAPEMTQVDANNTGDDLGDLELSIDPRPIV